MTDRPAARACPTWGRYTGDVMSGRAVLHLLADERVGLVEHVPPLRVAQDHPLAATVLKKRVCKV